MKHRLLTLPVALAVAGCATSDNRLSAEELRATRRVAVASLLNDTFQNRSIGLIVFQNKQSAGSVSDWKMNERVSSIAVTKLGALKQIEVASLNTSAIPEQDLKAQPLAVLVEAAKQQQFDKLVVIVNGRPEPQENRWLRPAFGYFENSAGGWSCLYANYTVLAYDVATKKSVNPIGLSQLPLPCDANGKVSVKFKDDFEAYTAEERSALREGVLAVFDKSLTDYLNRAFLNPLALARK